MNKVHAFFDKHLSREFRTIFKILVKILVKILIWFLLVCIIIPYIVQAFVIAWINLTDYRSVKSIRLGKDTYTLARKPYCKHNCDILVRCRGGRQCSFKVMAYNYNHNVDLLSGADITDITTQDDKLVIISPIEGVRFAQIWSENTLVEHYGFTCDLTPQYDTNTNMYSINCNYAKYDLDIIIKYR